MASTVGRLGELIRRSDEYHWQWSLFLSRPIDDCWGDTWAAMVEVDPYEVEDHPVTIVGVEYHPCLEVGTVQEIRADALAQLPNPSDDLLVAALRHYHRLDGFLAFTTDLRT